MDVAREVGNSAISGEDLGGRRSPKFLFVACCLHTGAPLAVMDLLELNPIQASGDQGVTTQARVRPILIS